MNSKVPYWSATNYGGKNLINRNRNNQAVLTLFEKGCDFNKKIVNIHEGEQNSPEYMRMNPNGMVPMLNDGPKIIVESEKIIDYIDNKVKTDLTLVPDEGTPIGKEVRRLRQFLDEIRIDVISYGLIYNEELSVTGVKVPKIMRKRETIDEKTKTMWEDLLKMAEKFPDLRDAYMTRYEMRKEFVKSFKDKEEVKKLLDDLDKRCDHMEECLKKIKQASSAEQEIWIAGTRYTAADICLVVFMDRMTMLGLEDRFFTKDKRPLLHDYRQRIGQRKAVQMLRADVRKAFINVLWKKVKTAMPYLAATLGVAVGVGVGIHFLKKK